MANSFGVTVIQIEPVPQRHGLWVSNHVSWLDIPVVGSVAPVFFLSKAEIGKWPILDAWQKQVARFLFSEAQEMWVR